MPFSVVFSDRFSVHGAIPVAILCSALFAAVRVFPYEVIVELETLLLNMRRTINKSYTNVVPACFPNLCSGISATSEDVRPIRSLSCSGAQCRNLKIALHVFVGAPSSYAITDALHKQ